MALLTQPSKGHTKERQATENLMKWLMRVPHKQLQGAFKGGGMCTPHIPVWIQLKHKPSFQGH